MPPREKGDHNHHQNDDDCNCNYYNQDWYELGTVWVTRRSADSYNYVWGEWRTKRLEASIKDWQMDIYSY